MKIAFPNAGQLATQADVRIAGVTVGKVVDKELDPKGNRTIATIQMNNQYAPIHRTPRRSCARRRSSARPTSRSPRARPTRPRCPTTACSPEGQVQSAVQLDQIFNAFDPTTRHAFQVWQQELAKAVQGNDQNLNSVLGNLPTFAADSSDILPVLDIQHTAVVNLVRNGGTVFSALSQNQSALRNLITSGEATFAHHGGQQQRARRHLPCLPDVPDRDEGRRWRGCSPSPSTPTR